MNDTWKNISPFGENILSNQNVFLLRVHSNVLSNQRIRESVSFILRGNSIFNFILNFTDIRIFMSLLVPISWMFSDGPQGLQTLFSYYPSTVLTWYENSRLGLTWDFWLYIEHAKASRLFNMSSDTFQVSSSLARREICCWVFNILLIGITLP